MSFEVKIIADSLAPCNIRLTTFQLKYPRFIHSEFLTHRAFSRNASSSRAIPVKKMLEWVESDPAMPVYWGSAKSGMQAGPELTGDDLFQAKTSWLWGVDKAVSCAQGMLAAGLHKQIANRVTEPWSHINVIVSATSFDNFFNLRCHPDAQPEIQKLAVLMARAYRDNEPDVLHDGEWHLPYVLPEEKVQFCIEEQIKISVARCCRVSYLTMEGKLPNPNDDFALHDRLIVDEHMSPTEHPAKATKYRNVVSGNFRGYVQYRQALPQNEPKLFDFSKLDSFSWIE